MKAARLLAVLFVLASGLEAAEGPRLSERLAAGPRGRYAVWVYFKDRGPAADALAAAQATVTPRAVARRAARGSAGVTVSDAPPSSAYVAAVSAAATRVRQQSRWMNAVSVEATPAQVAAIEALPFVARVDVVRGFQKRREEMDTRVAAMAAEPLRKASGLDYGTGFAQVNQIKVPFLHDVGLDGRGVIVGVLDAGFNNLRHEAFATMRILATRDFVNGDTDVGDGGRGEGSHGTATLSVIGGFKDGQIIGPAYAASYLLAKTEDTDSETPVEEDNWAAAVEWAEAQGVDVISTSLGYLTYDPPFPSYTAADMDGETAISTRAADRAGELGVVVVASAGNEGLNTRANTLGAPADGDLVLAVGAVSSTGARASFSSVGPTADGRIKPDVSAQGVSVKIAVPGGTNGYTTANGTSFSCPLTAGVAALLYLDLRMRREGLDVDLMRS